MDLWRLKCGEEMDEDKEGESELKVNNVNELLRSSNGAIDLEVFRKCILFHNSHISEEEIEEWFEAIDAGHSSFYPFCRLLLYLRSNNNVSEIKLYIYNSKIVIKHQ